VLRADPVGRFVSEEHVVDAGDAAVFAADNGEPFQREGRTGTVSQKTLKTLKVARHVTIEECDPDTRVDRKPAVEQGKPIVLVKMERWQVAFSGNFTDSAVGFDWSSLRHGQRDWQPKFPLS